MRNKSFTSWAFLIIHLEMYRKRLLNYWFIQLQKGKKIPSSQNFFMERVTSEDGDEDPCDLVGSLKKIELYRAVGCKFSLKNISRS